MKNLFKGLNKAGLLAILFAAVVITTQSAFTSTLNTEWGFDDVYAEAYVDINALPPTATPAETHYEYRCTQDEETCTVIYSSGNPNDGGTYVSDGQEGVFSLEEVETP